MKQCYHLSYFILLDFSAYTLILRLLLTKTLGMSQGTRLMHYSEVQKTDTKFVVGNSKYIYAVDGGMGNAARRLPKVDKGFMHRDDDVVLKLNGKHFVAGFLAHLNCG